MAAQRSSARPVQLNQSANLDSIPLFGWDEVGSLLKGCVAVREVVLDLAFLVHHLEMGQPVRSQLE